MSAFLGHIHYWLYDKIRLVIEREALIYAKVEREFGDSAEELRSLAWQTYGTPLPDKDLADIIDHSNIHGWLQRQVNTVEAREAAFIHEIVTAYGDTGCQIVVQAFGEHGENCGRHARKQAKYEISTPVGIYKALNDYLLNGMPCDKNDVVVENSSQRIIWENAICLQEKNWQRVGVDAGVMKQCYQRWLSGFVTALNPQWQYQQILDTLTGSNHNRHEIRSVQ